MTTTTPAIILCEPQLGENIGAAARAMANFGLADLRLVSPRDGWPNEKADAMAAGAAYVLQGARVFSSVREAVGDLKFVLATTARDRAVAKPVLTPAAAAARLRRAAAEGVPAGVLFGGERSGLDNDEIALADAIVTVPTDPRFSSLNLGQAVLLLGYEWFRAGDATPPERIDHGMALPAPREELFLLLSARQPAGNDPEFAGDPAPGAADRSGGPDPARGHRGPDQGQAAEGDS
jgi:tRNA/rRNA methyltransferase